MKNFKRKYIINENNERVAVQLDIKTFEKIERALEDFVLGEKMLKNHPTENLILKDAKAYYKRLKKST
ncbi:MAG: hypothetical protein KF775_08355 [Cyclobacteriaceae bacterium]|nr:hypothetical protein [Cyclobacteriaceae bacterium]